MSPPLQLNLGRRFGFSDWVDQAAHAIVHLPALSIGPTNIQLIGATSISLLNELHIKLLHHKARTSLMFLPLLATHAFGCRDQVKCLAQWKDVCLLLHRHVIRPEAPITDTQLLEIIETQDTITGLMAEMSADCVKQIKEKCREALVGKDEWLVQSIANKLAE